MDKMVNNLDRIGNTHRWRETKAAWYGIKESDKEWVLVVWRGRRDGKKLKNRAYHPVQVVGRRSPIDGDQAVCHEVIPWFGDQRNGICVGYSNRQPTRHKMLEDTYLCRLLAANWVSCTISSAASFVSVISASWVWSSMHFFDCAHAYAKSSGASWPLSPLMVTFSPRTLSIQAVDVKDANELV